MAGTAGLEPVLADLGDPRAVLSDPGTVSVLDLSQPAGVVQEAK